MNGIVITDSQELTELLEQRRTRVLFIADLIGDNGFELMIGIGCGVGCAQYSHSDGDPPYLGAVPPRRRVMAKYVEFLMNNTPTAIPGRNIFSFDEMKQIALHFMQTGERSNAFSWESI